MPSDHNFDVFISYNSQDKAWVANLKTALQRKGLRVWLDQDEIRPGDLFGKALEEGIRNSGAVALVVSPEALESSWVEEEYYRALSLANFQNRPLRLIPVLLRAATLPGFLSSRNWVDFRNASTFEASLDQLCWGITGNKAAPLETAPLPPIPHSVSAPPNSASHWQRWLATAVLAAVFTIFAGLWFATSESAGATSLSPAETCVVFVGLFALLSAIGAALKRLRGRAAADN